MKGTAARGRTADEDADQLQRLRTSAKERAEKRHDRRPGAQGLLASATLRERALHPADLHRADGFALVNSLRGWRAAECASDSHR